MSQLERTEGIKAEYAVTIKRHRCAACGIEVPYDNKPEWWPDNEIHLFARLPLCWNCVMEIFHDCDLYKLQIPPSVVTSTRAEAERLFDDQENRFAEICVRCRHMKVIDTDAMEVKPKTYIVDLYTKNREGIKKYFESDAYKKMYEAGYRVPVLYPMPSQSSYENNPLSYFTSPSNFVALVDEILWDYDPVCQHDRARIRQYNTAIGKYLDDTIATNKTAKLCPVFSGSMNPNSSEFDIYRVIAFTLEVPNETN